MKVKIGFRLILILAVLVIAGTELKAQTRITFGKGNRSATVSGTIPAKSNKEFVLSAEAGQMAIVYTTPGKLIIWNHEAPKGVYRTTYFETLAGDNIFGIYNPSNRAVRFSLTISIQ